MEEENRLEEEGGEQREGETVFSFSITKKEVTEAARLYAEVFDRHGLSSFRVSAERPSQCLDLLEQLGLLVSSRGEGEVPSYAVRHPFGTRSAWVARLFQSFEEYFYGVPEDKARRLRCHVPSGVEMDPNDLENGEALEFWSQFLRPDPVLGRRSAQERDEEEGGEDEAPRPRRRKVRRCEDRVGRNLRIAVRGHFDLSAFRRREDEEGEEEPHSEANYLVRFSGYTGAKARTLHKFYTYLWREKGLQQVFTLGVLDPWEEEAVHALCRLGLITRLYKKNSHHFGFNYCVPTYGKDKKLLKEFCAHAQRAEDRGQASFDFPIKAELWIHGEMKPCLRRRFSRYTANEEREEDE